MAQKNFVLQSGHAYLKAISKDELIKARGMGVVYQSIFTYDKKEAFTIKGSEEFAKGVAYAFAALLNIQSCPVKL
jgi:hypothetical protein